MGVVAVGLEGGVGRGVEEFVDEEDAVRWCGRLLVDEALPVRGRGFSVGGGGILGREGT